MPDSVSRRRLEWMIDSAPENVATVRRKAEAFARKGGFHEEAVDQIGLCLNEALANVIRHAYRGATDWPIAIGIEISAGEIHIRIRDWGSGANPPVRSGPAHDPLTPGGLGLICLRQWMDEVVYEPQTDGMVLKMTKRRQANGR